MPEIAAPKVLKRLDLPPLELKPRARAMGHLRHVLRGAASETIVGEAEIKVSARRQEQILDLSNGERIIVTTRSNVVRPAVADGLLFQEEGGGLRWVSHKAIDELESKIAGKGIAAIAREIADSWVGKFRFLGDTSSGLRPPQTGALHAIGSHWSLSAEPATIVMPTGTGKTETILSAFLAYPVGRLLVVVPSDVLRTQTARKFFTLGLLRDLGLIPVDLKNPIVGIVSRRPKQEEDLDFLQECNVIISTMSSIGDGSALGFSKAISELIETVVIDEAHHLGADGWVRFKEAYSSKRMLQFTATPFRRDGKLVDGEIIFSYPLRLAQRDGYFKHISFFPVYEINPEDADRSIAQSAVDKLRKDLSDGLDHILMARCSSIDRAESVLGLYQEFAPDLHPLLVHSEQADSADHVKALQAGESRIVACVNMLGEGFDLPQLKIAAIHDLHKSLAILLQFTGRFTRTAPANIGDATVLANIADPGVPEALERLYSEDADWNYLLSELSSNAAKEHAELIEFLSSSERLDDNEDSILPISHQLLRPTLGTLVYRADSFFPKKFHQGLPEDCNVHRVWLNQASKTLFFVTWKDVTVRWMRSKAITDREWALFVLHFNEEQKLLYLASSDHSSAFEKLAGVVGGKELVDGDRIFRALGRINRLIFQNIGVKKHGRRNLRYAMYTGSDVAQALSQSERAGSVKSNLNGTGWEGGRPITIGCSYKGRIWSQDRGPVPKFVHWCENVGSKLVDDSIDTKEIISNVLIPVEIAEIPDIPVLGIEWPLEIIAQSEERTTIAKGEEERPLSLFGIRVVGSDKKAIKFEIDEASDGVWGVFEIVLDNDTGFQVKQTEGTPLALKVGKIQSSIESYFSDYPPLVRFVDLSEMDGNLHIRPQNPQELQIPDERFEVWDWAGVDITKESIWKKGVERRDSIQWKVARHFIDGGFDVVFDDDSSGEAADLVCLKEGSDHVRLSLVHCKFSGSEDAGERVKDVVEVSSQAVRSAKWKWRFRDLCSHLLVREARLTGDGRQTRFLAGRLANINHFSRISRFKEVRAEIVIVQPGISKTGRTHDQSAVLAAALSYLKETIGVDMDVICSG